MLVAVYRRYTRSDTRSWSIIYYHTPKWLSVQWLAILLQVSDISHKPVLQQAAGFWSASLVVQKKLNIPSLIEYWVTLFLSAIFGNLRQTIFTLTSTAMRKAAANLARQTNAICSRNLSQVSQIQGHPPVQITALPNKIRVATESTPGHFSSVGLYVDAGSRYEGPSTSGVSHFLDRMAFKVSSTGRSKADAVLME